MVVNTTICVKAFVYGAFELLNRYAKCSANL
jgi:hypothetical protein